MQESLHQLRRGNCRHEDADDAELMKRSLMSIRRIRQERMDQDLLHRTVIEACQFSYGTKMVEVWVWDSGQSKLFRPEGGWWIDPYWHREGHTADSESCRFCQLVDASRTDFIAPPLLSPGVGIPGVLWSDLARGHNTRRHRKREGGAGGSNTTNSGVIDGNFLLQVFGNASLNLNDGRLLGDNSSNDPIAWRDVKALVEDPDQPQNHRMQVIAKTDLRWTCGVSFKIKDEEGIVVFYARDTVNLTKLRDKTNTDYLIQASDFIGSAWALRLPRMAAVQRRRHDTTHTFQRVKYALIFLIREGVSLRDLSKEASKTTNKMKRTRRERLSRQFSDVFHVERTEPCHQALFDKVKKKTRQSLLKLRGAGTEAPPTFGWQHTVLCMMGVLMSILTLGAFNDTMIANWGPQYAVPFGPVAALLGLQFGLTAAPAAQPRTIMVGQLVSMLIALAFAEIPSEKVWIKQSLACAFAVGAMAKIGVVNPPAAANAFVFASGRFGFTNMAVALLSNLLAIFCAIFINNLSDKRQYPSFWGIPPILQCMAKPIQKVHMEDDSTIGGLIRRTRAHKMKAEQDALLSEADGAANSTAPDIVAPNESADGSTSSPAFVKGEEIETGDDTPVLDRAEMGVTVKSPAASSIRSANSAALGLDSDRSVRFHPLDTVEAEVPPSSSRPSTHSRHRRSKAFMNSL